MFIDDLKRMGATDELIETLIYEYGGEAVYINRASYLSRPRRNKMIRDMRDKGVSLDEISQKFGISQRRVFQICSEMVLFKNE